MPVIKRDEEGNPLFDETTPVEVIIAHVVAVGTAGFDEFCQKVLVEGERKGQAGMISFDLRDADPEITVRIAKNILWGNPENVGLIQQTALCKSLDEVGGLLINQIHHMERMGHRNICDGVGSFARNVLCALTGTNITIEMARQRKNAAPSPAP